MAAAPATLKPFSAIPLPSFPSKALSPIRIFYPAAASGRRASSLSYPKRPAFVSLLARASDLAAAAPVEAGEAAVFDEGFDWGEPEAGLSEWEAEEEGGSGGREELAGEASEDAKLFVGNLPFDVESEDLAELFDKAGTVDIAEVIYNRDTDRSRGFGFVTMGSVEEAEKAVDMFNGYDINGRLIIVNKAVPRGSRVQQPRVFEPQFRLYVGNLPWQVDNARLEQVFSEHGKVLEARVVYDKETGRSRGFGFVIMSSQTELDDAIAALDGQGLDGRSLRVSIAEERPRRGGY